MPKKTDPILALDPGLRELGFAVLAGRRLVAAGVRPLRLLPKAARLREARRLVAGWTRAYHPRAIVFEATYRHPVDSLDALHRLTLSAGRIAKRRRIAIASYAPQSVRKSVHGDGWATKRQLAEAIAVRFPALRVYLTQDRRWKERYWLNMFDAISLALHHQSRSAKPPSRSRSSG